MEIDHRALDEYAMRGGRWIGYLLCYNDMDVILTAYLNEIRNIDGIQHAMATLTNTRPVDVWDRGQQYRAMGMLLEYCHGEAQRKLLPTFGTNERVSHLPGPIRFVPPERNVTEEEAAQTTTTNVDEFLLNTLLADQEQRQEPAKSRQQNVPQDRIIYDTLFSNLGVHGRDSIEKHDDLMEEDDDEEEAPPEEEVAPMEIAPEERTRHMLMKAAQAPGAFSAKRLRAPEKAKEAAAAPTATTTALKGKLRTKIAEKEAARKSKAAYKGAYVLSPVLGLHHLPILTVDFNSLYPNLIRTYRLCFTNFVLRSAFARFGLTAARCLRVELGSVESIQCGDVEDSQLKADGKARAQAPGHRGQLNSAAAGQARQGRLLCAVRGAALEARRRAQRQRVHPAGTAGPEARLCCAAARRAHRRRRQTRGLSVRGSARPAARPADDADPGAQGDAQQAEAAVQRRGAAQRVPGGVADPGAEAAGREGGGQLDVRRHGGAARHLCAARDRCRPGHRRGARPRGARRRDAGQRRTDDARRCGGLRRHRFRHDPAAAGHHRDEGARRQRDDRAVRTPDGREHQPSDGGHTDHRIRKVLGVHAVHRAQVLHHAAGQCHPKGKPARFLQDGGLLQGRREHQARLAGGGARHDRRRRQERVRGACARAVVEAAVETIRRQMRQLMSGDYNLADFVLSRQYNANYAVKPPHVRVVELMRERNPGSEPAVGSRVPFVMVQRPPQLMKKAFRAMKPRATDLAEDPQYAIAQNARLNLEYYINNKIRKPILRILNHFIQNANAVLFGETDAELRHRARICGDQKMGTIGAAFNFGLVRCRLCERLCKPDDVGQAQICEPCDLKSREFEQRSGLEVFQARVQLWRERAARCEAQCRGCQATNDAPVRDIDACTNQSCANWYNRDYARKQNAVWSAKAVGMQW
ncbi:DNA polymerase delta catalytic subunit [Sarracenia purpurea var. burkii]